MRVAARTSRSSIPSRRALVKYEAASQDEALRIRDDVAFFQAVRAVLAKRDPPPAQIICLDAGFQGIDRLKVNAVQTVKSRNRLKEGDLVFQVV